MSSKSLLMWSGLCFSLNKPKRRKVFSFRKWFRLNSPFVLAASRSWRKTIQINKNCFISAELQLLRSFRRKTTGFPSTESRKVRSSWDKTSSKVIKTRPFGAEFGSRPAGPGPELVRSKVDLRRTVGQVQGGSNQNYKLQRLQTHTGRDCSSQ